MRLATIDAKNAIEALKCASFLALDQFNGDGIKELETLNAYKVKNLPASITEIDFKSNSKHRSFTHKGWDALYADDRAHWPLRKEILLATTEKIFNFQWAASEWIGIEYNQKCDSFAALVYYVHVLGDHEARKSAKIDDVMMAFARPHADRNNPDMFSELKYHLSILFKDQKSSRKYTSLMSELDEIAADARDLETRTDGVYSEDDFQEFKDLVDQLFETLERYVPKLLAKEDFFKKVFPIVEIKNAA